MESADYWGPEVLECPHAFHRALRTESPVYEVPGAGYYLVTRYKDVQYVVMHPEVFSSNLIPALRGEHGGPTVLGFRAQGQEPTDVLGTADPPAHTRHRRLVTKILNVRRIALLEPAIRALAHQLVDAVAARGAVELMEQFAVPLPLTIITDLLALPRSDHETLRLWSDVGVELLSGATTPERLAQLNALTADWFAYLGEHFDRHCQSPGDDLMGDLVRATRDPEGAISRNEAIAMLVQLLSAGTETTTSLIGSAALRLLQEPGALAAARRDHSVLANFIEETLRLESPFYGHFRIAKTDTEIGGVRVPAGARLLVLWSSGNRDDEQFADAERFDPSRPNLKTHLGFGQGIHLCVGAPLARLETRIALETLIERLPGVRLAPENDLRHVPSVFVRRLQKLHLEFSPA